MTKKTRGPSGPSVLPRAAQDEKPRPKRAYDRDSKPARSGAGPRTGAGPRSSAGPRTSSGPRTGSRPAQQRSTHGNWFQAKLGSAFELGAAHRLRSSSRGRLQARGFVHAQRWPAHGRSAHGNSPRGQLGPAFELGSAHRLRSSSRGRLQARGVVRAQRRSAHRRSAHELRPRTGTRPGASSGPRSSSGPRTGSGPRREGGFKREGSFARSEGPRTGGPRTSSGPRTGTGSRPSSGPRSSSGPRREGGYKREGAYTRTDAPRTGTGPRREGGAPRSSGSSRYTGPQVPRDARGPRRRPTEATGKRHARPTRFDAATGKPIAADDRGARGGVGVKERPRSVGSAPAAAAPRRGPNVRDLALQVLFQVQVKRAFAERVIDDLAEQFRLDQRDRGFLNELVKGTLRWRGTLDWQLEPPAARRALEPPALDPERAAARRLPDPLPRPHPAARGGGRGGQARAQVRAPRHGGAVEQRAAPAGRRDRHARAAVARGDKADGTPDLDGITALTSHPRWLVERWLARFGVDETRALCEANNRTAALGLRVNRLRLDPKELIKRLEAAGLHADAGRWSDVSVGSRPTPTSATSRRTRAATARCRTRARRWSACWSGRTRTSACSTCAPRRAASPRTWPS